MRKRAKSSAKIARTERSRVSAEEWQLRCELAAAHRLVAHFVFVDMTYNHISVRLPENPQHFLVKPDNQFMEQVTASSLVKYDVDGNRVMDSSYKASPAAYNLHAAVLKTRPDIQACVHTHSPANLAVSAQKHGLLPITQQAMRFYKRIGYHPYEGITEDFGERERITRHLANNRALIMHNHGVLTVGKTAREAFILMKHLMEAAEIQLRMEATGGELIEIPPAIAKKTVAQYHKHDSGRGSADWPAYLRMLDKIDPSYRD